MGIPWPVTELSSVLGDRSKPGYPTIGLSDGEAKMAGVPDVENQMASLIGIPFYPVLINEAAPSTTITIPDDNNIIATMRVFCSGGTATPSEVCAG